MFQVDPEIVQNISVNIGLRLARDLRNFAEESSSEVKHVDGCVE